MKIGLDFSKKFSFSIDTPGGGAIVRCTINKYKKADDMSRAKSMG